MSDSVDATVTKMLSEAERAGHWDPVIVGLREHWNELFQCSPKRLLEVIASIPVGVLAENPRLRLAEQYLRRILDKRPETSAYRDIIADDPDAAPLDRLAALTGRIAVARSAGRHHDAVAATDAAVSMLRTVPVDVLPTFSNALPEFHYHWGVTYLLVSRFEDALEQFARSHDWAEFVGNRIVEGRSAGAAGFIHAVNGRGRHAAEWLAKLPPIPDEAWWASEASTPAKLSEAILHTERLETDAARAVLSGIDIRLALDYWGPYYAIRAFLTPDHPADAQALLSEFDAFVGDLTPAYSDIPLNAEYSALVRFFLLQTLHQPDRAVRALGDLRTDARTSLVRQTAATVQALRLLRLGRASEARSLIAPLLHVSSAHPRVLVPALLIEAEAGPARHREAALHRAVALAAWNRCYAALAHGEPERKRVLAELLSDGGDPVVAERLLSVCTASPMAGADALTRQEGAVVRAALAGQSNLEIAAAHHLSVNTVKTHLRTAYRKLGVSTRKQLRLLFEHRDH